MRPIWNGVISFGMVNIPVAVYSAVGKEDVSFNLLHEEDLGRIKNVRICQVCGEEIAYDDLVKGYQYEKDEYVPLTDEDFSKVAAEASNAISILDFVEQAEIDPMYFDKPYYLVPGKNADKGYTLLREALERTEKLGIAKFTFREKETLAAIKPNGRALMLDTMHFPDELRLPEKSVKVGPTEVKLAEQLIGMLSRKFDPEKYNDTSREKLEALIEDKLKGKKTRSTSKSKVAASTNVIDIMSRLKESLAKTKGKRRSVARTPVKAAAKRRKSKAA